MSYSVGPPIVVDEAIKAILGNVSDMGSLNVELGIDGSLTEFIEVGNMDEVPCLYDPPQYDSGNAMFDIMNNFMAGNKSECTKLVNEFFSLDLKTKGGVLPSPIRESERNVEYTMFNSPDSILAKALPKYQDSFSLLFPSKGTIARIARSAVRHKCRYVYLNSKMEDRYLENYKRVCDEENLKFIVVDYDYAFDLRLLYYASFNYNSVLKTGVPHYICCEPNMYQAVFNDVCSALCYNDRGYNLTYHRDGLRRSLTQLYDETNRCIIGADSLYQHYKTSKAVIGGIMHDVYSDIPYANYYINVPYGCSPISNTYCLVGNYYHKKNKIFDRKNNVVYENNGQNASNKRLSRDWKICDADGIFLRDASYLIGVFNSVAIFLGKKKVF